MRACIISRCIVFDLGPRLIYWTPLGKASYSLVLPKNRPHTHTHTSEEGLTQQQPLPNTTPPLSLSLSGDLHLFSISNRRRDVCPRSRRRWPITRLIHGEREKREKILNLSDALWWAPPVLFTAPDAFWFSFLYFVRATNRTNPRVESKDDARGNYTWACLLAEAFSFFCYLLSVCGIYLGIFECNKIFLKKLLKIFEYL